MAGYNIICVEVYMILRFVLTVWIMIIKKTFEARVVD